MRSSTNYNLNLVEGTDLVNPLIQDVPNYETIDSVMKANETASIGEAVELKSGTVHAITRTWNDTPVFRFTATSNFTAGETFTVDGVQVTALFTSGEALTTNCYIIGSEVLCSLKGTLMTVYASSGTVSVAENSNKLGGELPSYYGKATDVSTAQSTATSAGVLAQGVQSEVTTLKTLSSEETAIGIDEDGNTIYRKTFKGSILPTSFTSSGNRKTAIQLLIASLVKLEKCYGNVVYNFSSGAIMMGLNGCPMGGNNEMQYTSFIQGYSNSTNIGIQIATSLFSTITNVEYNVTIEYVKQI